MAGRRWKRTHVLRKVVATQTDVVIVLYVTFLSSDKPRQDDKSAGNGKRVGLEYRSVSDGLTLKLGWNFRCKARSNVVGLILGQDRKKQPLAGVEKYRYRKRLDRTHKTTSEVSRSLNIYLPNLESKIGTGHGRQSAAVTVTRLALSSANPRLHLLS
ncbi:hypothetical protein Bbelb_103040 [Branchiostoma belcheri]|nr:hypothetical protein Bbelb_103040 [Branchiostoma belcheri]